MHFVFAGPGSFDCNPNLFGGNLRLTNRNRTRRLDHSRSLSGHARAHIFHSSAPVEFCNVEDEVSGR